MRLLLYSTFRIPVHSRFLIPARSTHFPQHIILSDPENMFHTHREKNIIVLYIYIYMYVYVYVRAG
jgi:hypothetical protein